MNNVGEEDEGERVFTSLPVRRPSHNVLHNLPAGHQSHVQDESVVSAHAVLLFAIGPPLMPLPAGIEEEVQDHTCVKNSNNAAAGHAARPVWPGMLVRKRGGDGQHAMLPDEMSRAFFADAHELLPDFRKLR